MVHILDTNVTDMKLMSMLYNLLSNKDDTIYLVADSPFQIPKWTDIAARASYWFSKVHLIVGKPWYFVALNLNEFDSVNMRVVYDDSTIFTRTDSDLNIKVNKLTTKTSIIGGRKAEKFYKTFVGVDSASKELPFPVDTILLDSDLKVYNNIKPRLGDL